MTLTNSKVPYITLRDELVTLLRNNVATLNTDLTNTIAAGGLNQIKAGNPITDPITADLYPVILIKLVRKSEDFSNIGALGIKRPIITFKIFGIARIVQGAQDNEIGYLAQNIEGVIRDNFNQLTNCQWIDLTNADFGVGDFGKGTYVDVVAIDLECHCEVK